MGGRSESGEPQQKSEILRRSDLPAFPRGFQVEPPPDFSQGRMLAGLRARERFRLSPGSYCTLLPSPEGPVTFVEVVLTYRCGAAPGSL